MRGKQGGRERKEKGPEFLLALFLSGLDVSSHTGACGWRCILSIRKAATRGQTARRNWAVYVPYTFPLFFLAEIVKKKNTSNIETILCHFSGKAHSIVASVELQLWLDIICYVTWLFPKHLPPLRYCQLIVYNRLRHSLTTQQVCE